MVWVRLRFPREAYARRPELRRLVDIAEPAFAEAFRSAVDRVRTALDTEALREALEQGDLSRAVDLVDWEGVGAGVLFAGMGRAMRDLFEEAGESAALSLRRALARRLAGTAPAEALRQADIPFRFDILNPRVIEWIRENAGIRVAGITGDQRRALRRIMERAFRQGLPPRDAAKLIESVIGLTSAQAEALGDLRESLDAEGLTRAEIREEIAVRAGEMIAGRSIVIARTETIRAAYAGARETWRQAREQGLLPSESIQEWVVTPDDRLCPICEPLDGLTAAIDEPFAPGVFQPADPHPQCRCAIVMRPWGKDGPQA